MMNIRTLLAVSAALTIIPIVAGSPAQATVACGTAGFYFDGTDPRAMTHYGVAATINTKVPGLCGSSNSDVSVWTMMANNPSGNGGYVQSGYGRHAGQSTVYIFAQATRCDGCSVVHKEFGTPASSASYTQFYDFNGGKLYMRYNSTTLLTSTFDPILYWTGPWTPEWEGEAHQYGDDMPGTATSPVSFSNMTIKTCRSCAYTTPSGLTVSSDSTRYGVAWNTQNSKFSIWTK